MALLQRAHADALRRLSSPPSTDGMSTYATAVRDALERRGALFLPELAAATGLLATQVELALAELAAAGHVTSDGFAGLRALLTPSAKRPPIGGAPRRHRTASFGFEAAGRWSLLARAVPSGHNPAVVHDAGALELYAKVLLARYGVVFHRLRAREPLTLPWRELLMVYRRLEARGEIRGGRFVAGVTGEQFALPDAVARLRAARRAPRTGMLLAVSAADPLNLIGIVTPGERVPSLAANRIAFDDGRPVAILEAGRIRTLTDEQPERARAIAAVLTRRPVSGPRRARLGLSGRTPEPPRERSRRRGRSSAPAT
jgi:ATP-dependent Lhr-like helicase